MKLMYLLLLLPQQAAQQAAQDEAFVNVLVQRFNEGGEWMWPVLICFILGLAIAFERIVTLNRADINTRKFIVKVKRALDDRGIAGAEEVCANTRGPVASVFQAGLLRVDEGIEAVEKAVVSYGSIEMSFLERGLVWLSLFISVAPLLGFLGTVIGMIRAFDAIQQAGDISPSLVAEGIKIALLTTAFGLIVAVILQFFYNYAVTKIDRIVMEMEDASIELIDSLVLMEAGRPIQTDGPVRRTEKTSSSSTSGSSTSGSSTSGSSTSGSTPSGSSSSSPSGSSTS